MTAVLAINKAVTFTRSEEHQISSRPIMVVPVYIKYSEAAAMFEIEEA